MTGTITALRSVADRRQHGRPAASAGLTRSDVPRHPDVGIRTLPTEPVVGALLPGGALRAGTAYAVEGSTALMMAMLAGPSADGKWCGVVGVSAFGAAAARELGVDLDRLVLVPEPGREWLNVVAALADALTVVAVRPPDQVTSGEASRLAARLRHRSAVLIALGSWPGAEARLTVGEHRWAGLGPGHGYLAARQATVTVTGRGTAVRPRRHQLWLPGPDGAIRLATPRIEAEQAWQQEAAG